MAAYVLLLAGLIHFVLSLHVISIQAACLIETGVALRGHN